MTRHRSDLTGFANWLENSKFTASSVNNYTSNVRLCLRAMGNDPTQRAALLDYLDSLSSVRRTAVSCAWRAFADFAAEHGEPSIAGIPYVQMALRKRPVPVPELPCDPMEGELYAAAARFIVANGMKPATLIKLRWGDVTTQTIQHPHPSIGFGVLVKDPDRRPMHVVIPEATLAFLRRRVDPVNGTPTPEMPILPRVAGSLEVYPLVALRRWFP